MSAFAPQCRGLVTLRFYPRRPDCPANQYVVAYDVSAFPPLVRFGEEDLEEWKAWGPPNDLRDVRSAQSELPAPAPCDRRRTSVGFGTCDGVMFLRPWELGRVSQKMRVWIGLSWRPAHVAIPYKVGAACNRLTPTSPAGVEFCTSRYFDRALLGRYCLCRGWKYVDMTTSPMDPSNIPASGHESEASPRNPHRLPASVHVTRGSRSVADQRYRDDIWKSETIRPDSAEPTTRRRSSVSHTSSPDTATKRTYAGATQTDTSQSRTSPVGSKGPNRRTPDGRRVKPPAHRVAPSSEETRDRPRPDPAPKPAPPWRSSITFHEGSTETSDRDIPDPPPMRSAPIPPSTIALEYNCPAGVLIAHAAEGATIFEDVAPPITSERLETNRYKRRERQDRSRPYVTHVWTCAV